MNTLFREKSLGLPKKKRREKKESFATVYINISLIFHVFCKLFVSHDLRQCCINSDFGVL